MKKSAIGLYVLSALLVLAGVGLILYPSLRDSAADREQQQILEQWRKEMAAHSAAPSANIQPEGTPISGVPSPSSMGSQQATPAPTATAPTLADIPLIEEPEAPAPTRKPQATLPPAEGILSIEKIGLTMPILTGATNSNLHLSLASIEGTARAGQTGNYGIAGHRSRTRGRNFNRLDEVEIGDILQVETAEGTYRYTVDEKLLVLPEDTWVLMSDGVEKRITLVTCDPMIDPTHRLIVKGSLME